MKILISISVDWEGEHFDNLHDLIALRKKIGWHIPCTHFICPAYFTGELKNPAATIRKAISDNDEIALHIHCLQPLISKIPGVKFRTEKNYYKAQSRLIPSIIRKRLPKQVARFLQPRISGRGVPLSVYNDDEICKIIDYSKQLLASELGVSALFGFRAGGWLASDSVLKNTQKSGFVYDASAVPPEILSQDYSRYSIGTLRDDHGDRNGVFTDYILKMWGYEAQEEWFLKNYLTLQYNAQKAIKKTTQPYKIGDLIEMPNNCALSDFATHKKTMRPILNMALKKVSTDLGKPCFISIGCHQEGDIYNKLPLIEFIQSITDEEKQQIDFVTTKQAAVRFF